MGGRIGVGVESAGGLRHRDPLETDGTRSRVRARARLERRARAGAPPNAGGGSWALPSASRTLVRVMHELDTPSPRLVIPGRARHHPTAFGTVCAAWARGVDWRGA